jgi:hypothetical protein
MNKYEIKVTYTKLNSNNETVTKVMAFLVTSESLEDARLSVQETAMTFINRVNGTFISAE